MAKKTDIILKEVLGKVKPSKEELVEIERPLKAFVRHLEKRLKKLKIDAEIFVGGSFAKNTLIKKDKYDIDIFLRFDRKHKQEISNLIEKLLEKTEGVLKVKGSRNYFRFDATPTLFFEIVPVLKVKTPAEAENITDLSYSHVKYVNKKMKSEKMLDEIRIAKAFCYANNCYGAESYIRGFSGYGLELLVYYYGNFLKMIKTLIKSKGKVIIDIEKYHRNKSAVLMDLNKAKLQSPIVLIDPTYKYRNVLAALSEEVFEKFREECRKFLKNPSIKAFETGRINFEKEKTEALKKKEEFILIELSTEKQEGDIAGTKLLKFYNHLEKEINEFFEIKQKGFEYSRKQFARCFFSVKPKKEIIISGPFIDDKKNISAFRKKHQCIFEKDGRIYTREKIEFNLKEFLENWKKKNAKKIIEMYIKGLRVVD